MRSMWNGSISFGLVNVPIKLYSATEEHDLVGNQVHAHDHGRIKYQKVCEVCEAEVPSAEVAKRYDIGDQSAIVTSDEAKQLASEKSRTIQVVEFIPAESVDPVAYDKSYYLGPADGATSKPYALLARTLGDAGKVALVLFTLRSKSRLAALSVTGKNQIMVLHTLRWPDEIREPELSALDTAMLTRHRDELTSAEVEMASHVVEQMSALDFNPDKYHDVYREELRELVMSKLSDIPEVDAPEAVEEVSDLLAKLEASVAERSEKVAVPVAAEKSDKPNIRQWARANGHTVGERGRIPKDVVDKFQREAVPA